jgi:hypothetical protein
VGDWGFSHRPYFFYTEISMNKKTDGFIFLGENIHISKIKFDISEHIHNFLVLNEQNIVAVKKDLVDPLIPKARDMIMGFDKKKLEKISDFDDLLKFCALSIVLEEISSIDDISEYSDYEEE